MNMRDCSSIDPLFTPSAATPFRVGFIGAFTFFYFSGIRGSISGSPILGTTMIPLYSNFKAVQRAGFRDLPTTRRLRSRITLMSRLKPQICPTCAFVANGDLRTLALPVRTSSPTLRLQPWTWFPMQRHRAQGQNSLPSLID